MPARRKRSKPQEFSEGWDLVNASLCKVKEAAGEKQVLTSGLPSCDYPILCSISKESNSRKKKTQAGKQTAKHTTDIDNISTAEKQMLQTELHTKDPGEVDARTFEWVTQDEELEENYEVIDVSSVPPTPDRMSFTELPVPAINEQHGLVSQEPNLEKVLAEACKDQALFGNESVDSNCLKEEPPADTQCILTELPEEKVGETQQKKKKNRKKKPAVVTTTPEAIKSPDELHLELDEPAPLFSEVLLQPRLANSVVNVLEPVKTPVVEADAIPAVEAVADPIIESITEQKVIEESSQKEDNPPKNKVKKRKRCLNPNLADSFSDQEPVQEGPKVSEWITPKPLKPSKGVLKESNENRDEKPVKTETRQKKRSKSNKPKQEQKPEKVTEKAPKEGIKKIENKSQPLRAKNKQKNSKRQNTEQKKVARTHAAEEDNETWPLLWFRNRLDIFGLRKK